MNILAQQLRIPARVRHGPMGYATNWAQHVGSLAQITTRQEKSSDLNYATQAWQQTEAGKTSCSFFAFSPCLVNRAERMHAEAI